MHQTYMSKNNKQLGFIHLTFTSIDGTVTSEYIPHEQNIISNWFKNRYLDIRVALGREVYYWHIRHTFPATYRKVLDIQFIQHVQEAHDSGPKDWLERQHYNAAIRQYGPEFAYITAELQKKDDPYSACNPYAIAYSKQWLRPKPITPTLKLLYHGLPWQHAKEIQLELFDHEIKNIDRAIKNKKAKLKKSSTPKS